MVFICPKCCHSLISVGGTNKVACDTCRCIFSIKIELTEINGPDEYDDMVRQHSGEKSD
jgi:hypothetical protein